MTSHVREKGRAVEVCAAFLKLGLTAFGGPVAHLGYFREEFVIKRKWLEEKDFADLVALCQFLPGPASSQVGIAIVWGAPVTPERSRRGRRSRCRRLWHLLHSPTAYPCSGARWVAGGCTA